MVKLTKSYTARIDANANKSSVLISSLSTINEMSEYVFNKGNDYWFDFKFMYHDCREKFAEFLAIISTN